MRDRKLSDAFDRLAQAEQDFLGREFLAPVVRGHGVQVRIAGVRCRMRVEPAGFEGWGVFKPLSHSQARFARHAGMLERLRYLGMFPSLALILLRQAGGTWEALAASASDTRFQIEGAVPVRLVEEADLFDTVRARFDGAQFWFEALDERCDAGAAGFLREALANLTPPANLQRKGLTLQQQRAYLINYAARLEQKLADERSRGETRLREALEHAGAQLRDYVERGGIFRVTYVVDGRTHTSVVNKSDLKVRAAGVCLAGQDEDFDLASLVGVLREGNDEGQLTLVDAGD